MPSLRASSSKLAPSEREDAVEQPFESLKAGSWATHAKSGLWGADNPVCARRQDCVIVHLTQGEVYDRGMAEEKHRVVQHPLGGRQFLAECIHRATSGLWGMIGDFATVGGIVVGVVKIVAPHAYSWWAATITHLVHSGDELIWEIPAAIGGAILLARFVYAPFALYREKPTKATAQTDGSEPDVMLRFDTIRPADRTNEDAPIMAYNSKDMAIHIAIDPIETGDYQIGSEIGVDGKPVKPLVSSTTMVFTPVPDLAEKQEHETRLRLDSASVQFAIMAAVKQDLGLWWFIDHVYEHKWYDEQRFSSITEENYAGAEAAVKRVPIQIPLRVTYWNRTQAAQWERIETLNYDPSNRRAYIEHGRPSRLTKDGVAGNGRVLTDVGKALIIQRTKRLVEWCEMGQKRFITLGVAYSPTSPDAETFAHQVAAACSDAGFRLRGVTPLDMREIKQFPGIWVRKVTTWGAPEDPAIDVALKGALDDGGNKAQISWSDTYAQTTFEVIIGD